MKKINYPPNPKVKYDTYTYEPENGQNGQMVLVSWSWIPQSSPDRPV